MPDYLSIISINERPCSFPDNGLWLDNETTDDNTNNTRDPVLITIDAAGHPGDLVT